MDKVTRQCPKTTTFEEKGEPKRNWTVLLLGQTCSLDKTVSTDHNFGKREYLNYKVFKSLRFTELRNCVKVEVAGLGSLALTVLMVSVDVKQHWRRNLRKKRKERRKVKGDNCTGMKCSKYCAWWLPFMLELAIQRQMIGYDKPVR